MHICNKYRQICRVCRNMWGCLSSNFRNTLEFVTTAITTPHADYAWITWLACLPHCSARLLATARNQIASVAAAAVQLRKLHQAERRQNHELYVKQLVYRLTMTLMSRWPSSVTQKIERTTFLKARTNSVLLANSHKKKHMRPVKYEVL